MIPHELLLRQAANVSSSLNLMDAATVAANASDAGIYVICSWPVSDQYGTGSRVLYYVLVATCIFARNVGWLREACLAGTLLLPVVAGVHGIVLAAYHVPGAVDMDIYGVFQFCAVAVVAAPLTVRLSRTYNEHRGRNIIFVWAIFVVAGLLSIIIEFLRTQPTFCTQDNAGNLLTSNPATFPYGNATCNVECGDPGPFSPLRTGTANNIYLIPIPTVLTFHTAMLLSAGCCITASIMLVAMWVRNPEPQLPGPIEVPMDMRRRLPLRERLREFAIDRLSSYRRSPEVLPLSAAVIAIVVIGEKNLFSPQVAYQRESFATVGQWAPIAATAFAIAGSVYLLLAEAVSIEKARAAGPSAPGSPILAPMAERLDEYHRGHLLAPPARMIVRLTARLDALSPAADVTDFHDGVAGAFPTVPGEEFRDEKINKRKDSYQYRRRARTSSSATTTAAGAAGLATLEPTRSRRSTGSEPPLSPFSGAFGGPLRRTTTLDPIQHVDEEDLDVDLEAGILRERETEKGFLVRTASPRSMTLDASPPPTAASAIAPAVTSAAYAQSPDRSKGEKEKAEDEIAPVFSSSSSASSGKK